MMTTMNRPWSMRASIRQTYMTGGGAIIWQNRRLATGYSCVSSVEPGETQYPAVYRSAARNTAHHPDVSLRSRLSRRDKRRVPVKVPGLHVDLPRERVPCKDKLAMPENIVVRIVYAPKYSKVDRTRRESTMNLP